MIDKVFVPPIKIQGIKTKLVQLISEGMYISDETTWYEPFMGSGVVGLNLAPKHAVFADTNPHIINLYKSIQQGRITSCSVREFLQREGKLLAERDAQHYYYIRDRFNESHNPLDFLFLNRSCFNGMIRFNKDYNFNVPYCHKPNRFSKGYITKIVNQVKHLEDIFPDKDWVFKCQSFQDTIGEAKKNDFIYCDPPYIGRHVDYYDSWDEKSEIQLRDTLLASGAKFMLSTWDENKYRKNEYIKSIWNMCYKMNQEHFYFVGANEKNRNSMLEALLTNYDPKYLKYRKNGEDEQKIFCVSEQVLYKGDVQKMTFDFIKVFNEKVNEKKVSWEISALASPEGTLYSLGSDSKLIGRIFELISYNILQEIADENGYILQPSERQTVYPDFTLMKSLEDTRKIAIDIKTTYRSFRRNGVPTNYGFTLGSYASFMRNGTKNIMFPYDQYEKHYVIGYIYTRNPEASEGQKYSIDQLSSLPVPYKDVEVFVQEKYKIAGDKPGSGDTENIGSFKTNNMEFLINGEGPFSLLGLEEFESYWCGYPKYREKPKNYTSLDEYFEFQIDQGKDMAAQKRLYEYWKQQHPKQ